MKIYPPITSCRGTVECLRVVAEVLQMILTEAKLKGLEAEIVDCGKGISKKIKIPLRTP